MFSQFFFQPPNNTKTKICISFGLREFASSSLTTMVLLLSSVYPNHNIARRSPHNKDIVVWVPAPPHLPRLRCANTPVSQNYPLWWFSCLEFKWNRNNNCYAIILLSQFRVILIHANNWFAFLSFSLYLGLSRRMATRRRNSTLMTTCLSSLSFTAEKLS